MQEKLKVKIKKLSKENIIPTYAKNSDAGLDLTVVSSEISESNIIKYNFGLSFEIPDGYVGLIFPRSSCYKQGQLLSNCVGVIDSGYRGEVSVVMIGYNDNDIYKVGERAAQIIILPYPKIEFEEVQELSIS